MKIKFKNTILELIRFNMINQTLFPHNLIYPIILAAASWVYRGQFAELGWQHFTARIIIFFVEIVLILLGINIIFAFMSWLTGKSKSIIGEHSIEFKPEGIVKTSNGKSIIGGYETVYRYIVTFDYFIILVARSRGFLIPKRYLSEKEFDYLTAVFKEKKAELKDSNKTKRK